jgi:hypothetical protein
LLRLVQDDRGQGGGDHGADEKGIQEVAQSLSLQVGLLIWEQHLRNSRWFDQGPGHWWRLE